MLSTTYINHVLMTISPKTTNGDTVQYNKIETNSRATQNCFIPQRFTCHRGPEGTSGAMDVLQLVGLLESRLAHLETGALP